MNSVTVQVLFNVDEFLTLTESHKLLTCAKRLRSNHDRPYYLGLILAKSNSLTYDKFVFSVAMTLKAFISTKYKYESRTKIAHTYERYYVCKVRGYRMVRYSSKTYITYSLFEYDETSCCWKRAKQKQLYKMSLRSNNLKLTKLLPESELEKISLAMYPPVNVSTVDTGHTSEDWDCEVYPDDFRTVSLDNHRRLQVNALLM